ncbi:hypothetical protein PanWU01x14_059580, partial [Parasponia andersonii]
FRGGRKQEVLRPRQIRPLQQRLAVSPPHIDPGARDHHLLHPLRPPPRDVVRHNPAVARPDQAVPLHADRLHQPGDGGSLKGLRAVAGPSRGAAEEDEVRDVNVEFGGEELDLPAPLPRGHGTEAVDQDQRRLS